jgi:hypothetical protein
MRTTRDRRPRSITKGDGAGSKAVWASFAPAGKALEGARTG